MSTSFIDVPIDDVQPGDRALHVSGHLDSREVVAVTETGEIYFNLFGQWIGPCPKENYTYRRMKEVTP